MNKTTKSLLIEDIKAIEKRLDTDVIALYGYIEPNFIGYLKSVIPPDKKKSLTIILYTNGGDFGGGEGGIELFDKIITNEYEELSIIIPEHCLSSGTIVTFRADKLYICKNTSFGMIDFANLPEYGGNTLSVFHYLKSIGVKCTFIETDILENSLTFEPPSEFKHTENGSYLFYTTKLIELRKTIFNFLINHNLKHIEVKQDRNRTAIHIMNHLQYLDNYHFHDFHISYQDVIDLGLKVEFYDKSIEFYKVITDYHNRIKLILGRGDEEAWNPYGNHINCFMQSRYKCVI